MLKSLRIHNFQSHKDTLIEFHEGVNIIVGSSDSGKSAIMRALRWVIQDKPKGDSFRSWWGGDTKVEITLTDGTIIGKMRNNAGSVYYLNDLVFKAYGNDVPEAITTVLNIDDVNIQKQSDKPFLLSETAGEVAAHFNRMANLEKIDSSLSYVTTELNRVKNRLDAKENEYKENRKAFRDMGWVVDLETDLSLLEEKAYRQEKLINEKQRIWLLLDEISEIQSQVDKRTWVEGVQNAVLTIERLMKKSDYSLEQAESLAALTTNALYQRNEIAVLTENCKAESLINELSQKQAILGDINSQVYKLSTLLQNARKTSEKQRKTADILESEPMLLQVAEKITERREVINMKTSILSMITALVSKASVISAHINTLKTLETTWHNEMKGNCPICGNLLI